MYVPVALLIVSVQPCAISSSECSLSWHWNYIEFKLIIKHQFPAKFLGSTVVIIVFNRLYRYTLTFNY